MAYNKTSAIMNRIRRVNKKDRPLELTTGVGSGGFNLPNNSGRHEKGTRTEAPLEDFDLANKKYVDDEVAGVGTPTHAATTGQTANDHHNEAHSHTHASTTGQGTDDHHSKQHAINDAANHTSPLDPGQMIMANVITGLPNNATNTNVEVAGAVNHSAGDGSDHTDVASNTTHRSSDGSDHSKVTANETSIGTNTTAIGLNTTHRGSNGTDHANVVTNDTHTAGDGSDHADVATNTAASHAESHTVASHNDTTATGTELETLTDGSNADALHAHTAVASHSIASHNDTSGTGAELNVLTDNSNVDTLHKHSKLFAPDGTPEGVTCEGNAGIVSMIAQSRAQTGRDAAQSLGNNVYTDVAFDTDIYDEHGEMAAGIFTATITGYYLVTFSVLLTAMWSNGEVIEAGVSKNNSTAKGSFWATQWTAMATATMNGCVSSSAVVYLEATDTVRIKVYHNQGATVNISDRRYNRMSVHKLS